MYEYIGNLHIHSNHSDGKSSIAEIARIGNRVGIDFLCFNDHNSLAALHQGEEGWYGNVLVLIGTEIGNRFHHYLAYRVETEIPPNEDPQTYIDGVKVQGGFGFIAHPFERGCPLFEDGWAFTWNDWTVTGYDGICIWNYSSAWKEKVRTVFHGLYYYIHRRGTLQGPAIKTLERWDKECERRKVSAIGGSDAHAYEFRLGGFSFCIFPYRYLFRAINTHILIDEPLQKVFQKDKERVYRALQRGNSFIAHDLIGDSTGFRFMAVSGRKRTGMGEEAPLEKGLTLWVLSPKKARIILVKDGRRILRSHGRTLMHPVTERGVYRVELYTPFLLSHRPWIYSNPIYVD